MMMTITEAEAIGEHEASQRPDVAERTRRMARARAKLAELDFWAAQALKNADVKERAEWLRTRDTLKRLMGLRKEKL